MAKKYIWLSHVLDLKTPLYAGKDNISIERDKSITAGASCNTSILSFPSHVGTHVDAPLHFLIKGKGVEEYLPDTWIFKHPRIVYFQVQPGQLIKPKDLFQSDFKDNLTDLLLLCSGFEQYRETDTYWEESPGLLPELAKYFKDTFTNLRAVGMDFISVSSLRHREIGRSAHKSFLKLDILLIEDMSLSVLNSSCEIKEVIALPLRFSNADGAPCTVIGYEE